MVTTAGKLAGAANGGEAAAQSLRNMPLTGQSQSELPSPVCMLRNTVEVLVDGTRTMALIDTGATVFVISFAFKSRLGRKVMFKWDQMVTFRGVGGESLCPLGVCSVNVSFGGHTFRAEFAVLPRSTHDVILGLDFLKQCGATVDCRNGEIYVDGTALSALVEDSSCDERALRVFSDTIIPPRSAAFVSVLTTGVGIGAFEALIEPIPLNCAKKDILVPRSVVSVVQGHTKLTTLLRPLCFHVD